MKISTLIFDVNETLLDLAPLKESINAAFNDKNAVEIWFSQLLHYSLVESITGSYHDFSEIAAAVLKMNGQKSGKDFSDKDIKEVLSPITKLNAYNDVQPGLGKLKKAGYRLIAFSNGKPSVLKEQLEYSKLDQFFDEVLSVEGIQKYKPHPDSYKYALSRTNSSAQDTMMVAAHGWDIAGALRTGLHTAFIQRPGKFLFPLAQKPTIETPDIERLARELQGSFQN